MSKRHKYDIEIEGEIDITGDYKAGGSVVIHSNGALEIDTSESNATGTTTTGSVTDVVLSGMAQTPGEGRYIVLFSCSAELSTTGYVYFSIYLNGSQVNSTERRFLMEGSINNTALVVATHDEAFIGAAQDIDIRWRVAAGTGTCYQRKMTLIKVSET